MNMLFRVFHRLPPVTVENLPTMTFRDDLVTSLAQSSIHLQELIHYQQTSGRGKWKKGLDLVKSVIVSLR